MKKIKKCEMCQGFGFWPMGDLCPMGEFDSKDWGKKVVQCPWCSAGYDNKSDRYKYLLQSKKTMDNEKEKSR